MENSLYAGLSYQMALRREMDIVSNNVANMNTTGFKGQRPLFLEHLAEVDGGGALSRHQDALSMVIDHGVAHDLRQGDMIRTGNTLDVAVEGDGYLVVGTDGGPRYTRHGKLAIDVERRLVDPNGLPVLDDGNQPIIVPPGANEIAIRADGAMSADGLPIATLQMVEFADRQELIGLGGGLYASNQVPVAAEDTRLVQGMIEGSNVEPIVEMTRMIDVMRRYQSAQSLMEREDERLREAIRRLGAVEA